MYVDQFSTCVYMSYNIFICVYMMFQIKRHMSTSVISWWHIIRHGHMKLEYLPVHVWNLNIDLDVYIHYDAHINTYTLHENLHANLIACGKAYVVCWMLSDVKGSLHIQWLHIHNMNTHKRPHTHTHIYSCTHGRTYAPTHPRAHAHIHVKKPFAHALL